MLEELKKEVLEANLELPKKGLITYTWGNVSGIDRNKGLIVIKPSGVEYDNMKVEDLVVVDFNGEVVEGHYKPSSDTATHIELYKAFPNIEGVVHTHSTWATIFAQAGKDLVAYGTTHADYFCGDIPCTRKMDSSEIKGKYEKETGTVIIETIKEKKLNPDHMPAILVNSHGPFTWGSSPSNAVHNAVVLEELAKMAYNTEKLNSEVKQMQSELLEKHFYRKHGKDAYYGQK